MNLDSPSVNQEPGRVAASCRQSLALAAMMFGLIFLVGCANPKIAYSWRGEPADALIAAWGEPTTDAALADGTREIAYTYENTVQFVDLRCAATFQVGPDGIIAEALVEGDQRGCNGLLTGKSAKTGRTQSVRFGFQFTLTGR